jgi:hypothetical protein
MRNFKLKSILISVLLGASLTASAAGPVCSGGTCTCNPGCQIGCTAGRCALCNRDGCVIIND